MYETYLKCWTCNTDLYKNHSKTITSCLKLVWIDYLPIGILRMYLFIKSNIKYKIVFLYRAYKFMTNLIYKYVRINIIMIIHF